MRDTRSKNKKSLITLGVLQNPSIDLTDCTLCVIKSIFAENLRKVFLL